MRLDFYPIRAYGACLAAICAALSVVPTHAGTMAMLLERGPIPYLQGEPVLLTTGRATGGDFANPAWGDYTGDGIADLLVGNDYGDLTLYPRTGDAVLAPPQPMLKHSQTLPSPDVDRPACPCICDIDGDGQVDLLLGSDTELLIYWGKSPTASARALRTAEGAVLFGSGDVRGLAPHAVDFDGDGDLDLIVGDRSGLVWWVANGSSGAPSFSAPAPLAVATGSIVKVPGRARPTSGDCDGDGVLDLLVGAADGLVYLHRGTRQGLSEPIALQSSTPTAGAASPLAADVDGDGRPEVLVGDADGFISVHRCSGAGLECSGYMQASRVPLDVGRYAAATMIDYNADGTPDILTGDESGHVRVAFGANGGYLEPRLVTDHAGNAIRVPGGAPGAFAWPRIADMDGDGAADLLAGGAGGTIHLWLNKGGFRYAGELKMAGEPIRVNGLSTISAVDYDGDGDNDLFVGIAPRPNGDGDAGADFAGPQFVLPEGGLMYFENAAAKGGGLPVLSKGVRLLGFIGEAGSDSVAINAGVLGMRYIEPLWLHNRNWTFLVGTVRGWFQFGSTNARNEYPTLMLPAPAGTIPRATIPPCYSLTATRTPNAVAGDAGPGLLCGTGHYGFCCYYPPSSARVVLGL